MSRTAVRRGARSNAPPSAIVFDWDNTLVDTWAVIHTSLNETLTAMGHAPWRMEETRRRVSRSLRDSFPSLFGDRWEEARDIFYTAFEARHLADLSPLPGAQEILQALQARPVPLFILSNKQGRYLRDEIEHLGWGRYFTAVGGAGDFPVDKPDPGALTALMGLPPGGGGRDIVIIGDTVSDIELANRSDCGAVLFNPNAGARDPKLDEFRVDREIDHLSKTLDLFGL